MKDGNDKEHKKPDPERVAILRSLPMKVKEAISGDEASTFMYGGDIPPSLMEKLKPFLVDDDV